MTDEQWEEIAPLYTGMRKCTWSKCGLTDAVLSVAVHAANIHDTKGGIFTAKPAYERYLSIQKFCADAGYRGTFVSDMKEQLDLDVDISEKIKPR